jgi:hypothetical protein
MPADDGLWLDNEEHIGPAGPEAAQDGPKQPVARVQGWPRSFALEHRDLLPKSKDFQGCIASCTEENSERKQESEEELNHELTVVT